MARGLLIGACGALLAASSVGCAARVYAEPAPVYGSYDTYYAEEMPENIYAYPHVMYEGQYAYYVDGNWYYPHGDRWVVFRHAPPELERQRVYVQQAPPARRGYYERREYRGAPPAAYPPPAERVR